MKKIWAGAFLSLGAGLALQAAPAGAWWQWYQQEVPYAPVPAFWFYQNIPQVPAFGQTQPWLWYYQTPGAGSASMWTIPGPLSSLHVEQTQTPLGYYVRVNTGQQGLREVDVNVAGNVLVIRSRSVVDTGIPLQMQQAGWMTQWLSLPADTDLAAMRMQRGDGVIEIFIPRIR